jgi:hypothetical protein
MKGFPDGVPAIAQSVMAGLQGQGEGMPEETMEGREAAGEEGLMRYGGMPKYQTAGAVRFTQSQGDKVYVDGKPYIYQSEEDNPGLFTGDTLIFKSPDGKQTWKMDKDTFMKKVQGTGEPGGKYPFFQNVMYQGDKKVVQNVGLQPNKPVDYNTASTTIGGQYFKKGDIFSDGRKTYKVLDPFVRTTQYTGSSISPTTMAPVSSSASYTDALKTVELTPQYDPQTGDVSNYIESTTPQFVTPSTIYSANKNKTFVRRDATGRIINASTVAPASYTQQEAASTGARDLMTSAEEVVEEDMPATTTKVVIKEDNSKPAAKTTVTSNTNVTPKPVRRVPGKMQTIPNFIVPSGPHQGQQVKAVQRGDTIRAYYPNGTHEAFLNGKIIPGYRHGGDLPKHQGDTGPSTVGDASSSSMMDDGSSNGFFGGIGDSFSDLFSGDNESKNNSTTSSFDQQAIDAVANPAAVSASTSVNIPPAATNPTVANSQLFTPEVTPTPAFQPFMANTAQGIENGSVAPVSTGDPNKQVIANNNTTFEINPSSVKSLPFTPKDKSTYAPWKPENYDKQWKPMAEQAMLNPEGARAIDEYMTGLIKSNTFGPNIAAQLEGLTGQARYDKILELATDGKPGLFHNAFLEAMTKKPETPKETPGEKPAKKRAWSCRQDPATGVKEIYEFEYEGEMPSGSYNTRAEAEAGCNGQPAPEKPKRRRPWWLQDTVNFAGAMTDMIDKYGPAMSQVDFETPGYVLEDPDRQIAAMQEAAAADREAAYNTTAGNVAGASQVAPSNQRLGQAANIIAGVENRNVNTVNQALGRNAQINNQERLTNEQLKQKYIAESATANQNYDNARRALKWRQLQAFNNGVSNFQRTNQLESMFPQYAFDRISGDVGFTEGRQAYDEYGNRLYDPYINPMGSTGKSSSSGSGYLTGAELAALKKEYIDAGFTDKEAIELINQQTGRASSNSRSPQNTVANAVMTGSTMPQNVKYGGYKKQYGGTVIDFGALPLYFFED